MMVYIVGQQEIILNKPRIQWLNHVMASNRQTFTSTSTQYRHKWTLSNIISQTFSQHTWHEKNMTKWATHDVNLFAWSTWTSKRHPNKFGVPEKSSNHQTNKASTKKKSTLTHLKVTTAMFHSTKRSDIVAPATSCRQVFGQHNSPQKGPAGSSFVRRWRTAFSGTTRHSVQFFVDDLNVTIIVRRNIIYIRWSFLKSHGLIASKK